MRKTWWLFLAFLTLGGIQHQSMRPAPDGFRAVTDADLNQPPRPKKFSGAFESLSRWGESRSYPRSQLPAAAYHDGFLRSREMPAESLGKRLLQPWQPLGPDNIGGRTLCVAFDPVDPTIIYAGSASGGLWRSDSAGVGASAWVRIDTGFPVLAVSSIAFTAGDPLTIYLGTGEVYNHQTAGTGPAYRSTRGSYGIGILKSVDGGINWSKSLDWTANQIHGVWDVVVDPTNADVVWAATTEGVYKSLDAGASWNLKLDVVMANDLVIHPGTPDIVVVGCGNFESPGHGLYRTIDGGESWNQITTGVPATFAGKVQLDISRSDPDVLYASFGNGFGISEFDDGASWLCRSLDAGATWEIRSTEDYSRWQGWYSHDVAIHPTDPTTVVAIGIDIWKSSGAGGSALTQVSDYITIYQGDLPPGAPEGPPTYSHADHHDVKYHPTDPDTIYFANDGGIFRSLDGGVTFEGCNGGYRTSQFYAGFSSDAANPNLALGGLQDNATAIYRGSSTWSKFQIGGDGAWAAIQPDDSNILYGCAQHLYIAKSYNNGASWTQVVSPPDREVSSFIAPFLVSQTNPLSLYASHDIVFKSFDGGNVWFLGNQGLPLDGNPALAMAVAPTNDDVLYIATAPLVQRGRVHRTLNGGATFTDITGFLPDRYPGDMFVHPTDAGTVYITFSGFGSSHLFRSSDFGDSWQDIDNGLLPDVPTSAVAVDPLLPDHIYVGNDLGVFVSVNAGLSWSRFAAGMSSAVLVYDLSISPSDRKLRAVTHGLGVYERDLVGVAVAAEPQPLASRLKLEQNVPNPFNPSTQIRFSLPNAGHVRLSIYDVAGRLVRTLLDGPVESGSKAVEWDGRNDAGRVVSSGTYFYRLHTGEGVVTKNMVLLK